MSDVERKKPRITEFGPCHDEVQELESLRQRVKELEVVVKHWQSKYERERELYDKLDEETK